MITRGQHIDYSSLAKTTARTNSNGDDLNDALATILMGQAA